MGASSVSMKKRTKKLYVFRGLPGSGKSSTARSLGCLVIEPDSWHVQDGKYQWDTDNRQKALRKAWNVLESAMENGFDVAVAEVLHKKNMVVPLLQIASRHGYETIVFDIKITAEESKKRNIHGVDPNDIDMLEREWEDWN